MKLIKRLRIPSLASELVVVHATQQQFRDMRSTDPIVQALLVEGRSHLPADGIVVAQATRTALIFIDAHDTAAKKRLTCVHEAVHAAAALLALIGHKHDGQEDEVLAYLIEWITEQTWQVCKL